MMRRLALAWIACAAALVAQQPPESRPQTPTFRSGVTYVEVEVTVTGADGRSIDDLRQQDFSLLDGGALQEISTFARIDIPVARTGPLPSGSLKTPVFADSVSNTTGSGRVFALVLDEQQTAFRDTNRVIEAANRFVEQYVGAGDLVAVVGTGGRVAQSFTTERPFVFRAVDRFRGQRAQSAAEAGADDTTLNVGTPSWMAEVAHNPWAVIAKNDQCMNILHTMGTVSSLSRYMTRIPHRRRAVVLFGSGVRMAPDCDDRIVQHTIDDVNRAGVTVYGVDVRGLGEAGTPLTFNNGGSDPGKPVWASALHDEKVSEQDTLRYLANETGGFAAVNLNDLAPAFARIMRENSSYYLLGFTPANDRRDGKYHDIDVKVSRPDVEVRARKGYIAGGSSDADEPRGARTSAALGEALANPVPVTGIPMRASVAAFRGSGKKLAALSVTLELDASKFAFRESRGLQIDALEVAFYSGRRGKAVLDAHEMLQLSLGDNFAAVRERGLRIGQRVELPPGHHRLLVGVREANGGLIGTLPFELDVPDFSKFSPSMSSIVLTSSEASRVQTTHADVTLRNALPAPPTARRTFARDDQVSVFAEVYGSSSELAGMEVSATVTREDGTRAASVDATPHARGDSTSVAYTGRLNVSALAPGRYVLTVRAARPGGTPIARSTPLEVR